MEACLIEACPPENIEAVFGLMFLFFICFMMFLGAAVGILYVIAFCKIFSKAGYSWALGLLMLVPIANVIMPLYLGFAKWPIEKAKQPESKSPT